MPGRLTQHYQQLEIFREVKTCVENTYINQSWRSLEVKRITCRPFSTNKNPWKFLFFHARKWQLIEHKPFFHFSFQFTETNSMLLKTSQLMEEATELCFFFLVLDVWPNILCKGFLIKTVFTSASRNRAENGCKRNLKTVLVLWNGSTYTYHMSVLSVSSKLITFSKAILKVFPCIPRTTKPYEIFLL